MSTLWTPDGEKPVERAPEELTEEELAERLEALREQLAQTPVADIVTQSAYQFFEVGALHLSVIPPQLDEAKLAIDALGLLVEGLGDRLGPNAATLRDGLTNIRLAFVEVSKAVATAQAEAAGDTASE
ncbi:MAG TPA: hypothetical protein VHC63_15605 [Acidimicrobiales bacterium]|nr:hypothetical protein [Acidimicrobiales bacterium]